MIFRTNHHPPYPPFTMKKLTLILAFAALLVSGCKKAAVSTASPFNVRYVTARAPGHLARETGPAFLGFIRGDTETSLSFKVNGQLVRIGPADGDDWKDGTFVEAGTVLAQVDTANFVSAVASARAQAELARATFTRNSELYAAANLSKNDFEASRAQMETAAANLATAEQNLRDTTLRAPYAGVILSRSAKSGEYAAAGHSVLRIGDFHRVSIEVGVPDTLLGELTIGQNYNIRVSAFEGGSFAGTISEIGTAAAENSRLFRVVLKVDNADGRLKSGMTASVRLGGTALAAEHGVLVPLSALVATDRSGSDSAVFIVSTDNHVVERAIKTGDIVASSIHVTRGLAAGDKVVTQGAGQLFDGALVNAETAAIR
jgi:RND family efflux transporter MFP subunit